MASTVVECSVVEECPPCRMPPTTAAAPACPNWAALLTTDLPEAKGQDQEMQAAPDQEMEAALAWMPLTGSKRRRWQSASWVVAPLQRHRASVKSARRSYAATRCSSRGGPACSGLPSGTGKRDPTRDCLDAEARLLYRSRALCVVSPPEASAISLPFTTQAVLAAQAVQAARHQRARAQDWNLPRVHGRRGRLEGTNFRLVGG